MNYFGAVGREAFIIFINCFTLSLQYNRIVSELKTIQIEDKTFPQIVKGIQYFMLAMSSAV